MDTAGLPPGHTEWTLLRAQYGLLECDLRDASESSEWQAAVNRLAGLDLLCEDGYAAGVSLFCEKCIKLLLETNDREIAWCVDHLAKNKLKHLDQHTHPAYDLLTSIVSAVAGPAFPVLESFKQDEMGGLLRAYLQTRTMVLDGDHSARLARISDWRALLDSSPEWPELVAAYLHQLDRWAKEAYQQQEFALAAVLWGEAERVAPVNTAVAHNLALTYTRLGGGV